MVREKIKTLNNNDNSDTTENMKSERFLKKLRNDKYKGYKYNFGSMMHLLYKLVQSKKDGDCIKVTKNFNNSHSVNVELCANGMEHAKNYIKYSLNNNTSNNCGNHNSSNHNSHRNNSSNNSGDRDKNNDKITSEFHNSNVKLMHDMAKDFGSSTIITSGNTNTHSNANSNSSNLPHNIAMIQTDLTDPRTVNTANKSSSAEAYGGHNNNNNYHKNHNYHMHQHGMQVLSFCQTSTQQLVRNVKSITNHDFSSPNNLVNMRNIQRSQQNLHSNNYNDKNKHTKKNSLWNKPWSSHHYLRHYQLGGTFQTPRSIEYFEHRNIQNQFGERGKHKSNNTNSSNNNNNTKYRRQTKHKQQTNYHSTQPEAGVLDFSSAGSGGGRSYRITPILAPASIMMPTIVHQVANKLDTNTSIISNSISNNNINTYHHRVNLRHYGGSHKRSPSLDCQLVAVSGATVTHKVVVIIY